MHDLERGVSEGRSAYEQLRAAKAYLAERLEAAQGHASDCSGPDWGAGGVTSPQEGAVAPPSVVAALQPPLQPMSEQCVDHSWRRPGGGDSITRVTAVKAGIMAVEAGVSSKLGQNTPADARGAPTSDPTSVSADGNCCCSTASVCSEPRSLVETRAVAAADNGPRADAAAAGRGEQEVADGAEDAAVVAQVWTAALAASREEAQVSGQALELGRLREAADDRAAGGRCGEHGVDLEQCEARLYQLERDLTLKEQQLASLHSSTLAGDAARVASLALVAELQERLAAKDRQLDQLRAHACDVTRELELRQGVLQSLEARLGQAERAVSHTGLNPEPPHMSTHCGRSLNASTSSNLTLAGSTPLAWPALGTSAPSFVAGVEPLYPQETPLEDAKAWVQQFCDQLAARDSRHVGQQWTDTGPTTTSMRELLPGSQMGSADIATSISSSVPTADGTPIAMPDSRVQECAGMRKLEQLGSDFETLVLRLAGDKAGAVKSLEEKIADLEAMIGKVPPGAAPAQGLLPYTSFSSAKTAIGSACPSLATSPLRLSRSLEVCVRSPQQGQVLGARCRSPVPGPAFAFGRQGCGHVEASLSRQMAPPNRLSNASAQPSVVATPAPPAPHFVSPTNRAPEPRSGGSTQGSLVAAVSQPLSPGPHARLRLSAVTPPRQGRCTGTSFAVACGGGPLPAASQHLSVAATWRRPPSVADLAVVDCRSVSPHRVRCSRAPLAGSATSPSLLQAVPTPMGLASCLEQMRLLQGALQAAATQSAQAVIRSPSASAAASRTASPMAGSATPSFIGRAWPVLGK